MGLREENSCFKKRFGRREPDPSMLSCSNWLRYYSYFRNTRSALGTVSQQGGDSFPCFWAEQEQEKKNEKEKLEARNVAPGCSGDRNSASFVRRAQKSVEIQHS